MNVEKLTMLHKALNEAIAAGELDKAAQIEADANKEIALLEAQKRAAAMQAYMHEPAGQLPMSDKGKAKPAGEFKSFGEFLKAARNGNDPRLVKDSGGPEEAKDLLEGTGATGGFLVPQQFIPQLMSVAAEQSIVEPRATVIPMASRSALIPALDLSRGTSGETGFYGGVDITWTEEAGSKTESQPYFKQIELVAHKKVGYVEASDELLADNAVGLEAVLTRLFGGAIAWTDDWAYLKGNGVGKPLGIYNAGATITVTRSAANAFDYIDAVNMMARTLPGGQYVWVMAQSVMPQLYQFHDAANNYIWQPNAVPAGANTLLGWPIFFTEKLPVLGSTGDVMLCDFSHYLIGRRQGLTIGRSTEYRFQYDLTAWRFVERVDGQPWLDAAITLADGTTTVSPFVMLGAYS